MINAVAKHRSGIKAQRISKNNAKFKHKFQIFAEIFLFYIRIGSHLTAYLINLLKIRLMATHYTTNGI